MKFTEQVAAFQCKYSNIMKHMNGLEAQKLELNNQLELAEKAYSEMLIAGSTSGEKLPAKDLATAKKGLEKIKGRINDIEEMAQAIRTEGFEQLRSLLPDMANACEKDIMEVISEINQGANELRKHKAEFLIATAALNLFYQQAQEVRSVLLAAAHKVGSNEYDRVTVFLPSLNMTSTYEPDKALAPLQYEVERAYRGGVLPSWVEWYRRHGELLEGSEAHHKLEAEKVKQ